jgi:periplasmic protein TonB
MSATMNAFPPLHAFNSSRGWFLALIVLLHAGFFWVLTHGVTIGSLNIQPPLILVQPEPAKPQPPPKPPEVRPNIDRPFVPVVERPQLPEEVEPNNAPIVVSHDPAPPRETVGERPGAGPLIVEPQGDPRFPFTEPEYPVSEIRLGHEGTVWLSIEILPSGRVGLVRIDQSSGFVKLDDSAVREARRWRMKPGMQDGVATARWKRVPITFQLKN